MDIRGTETEKNLLQAYVGKTETSCRHRLYATQALAEGLPEKAQLFEAIASQDEELARGFMAYFHAGRTSIFMTVPVTVAVAGVLSTPENLRLAARTARELWTELYPRFAEEARSEGLDEIANLFQDTAFCCRQQELKFA